VIIHAICSVLHRFTGGARKTYFSSLHESTVAYRGETPWLSCSAQLPKVQYHAPRQMSVEKKTLSWVTTSAGPLAPARRLPLTNQTKKVVASASQRTFMSRNVILFEAANLRVVSR
jgi:hypothetical protein